VEGITFLYTLTRAKSLALHAVPLLQLLMLVFLVVTLCRLVGDTKVSEEHTASVFRATQINIDIFIAVKILSHIVL
jgi:hypothetical protein